MNKKDILICAIIIILTLCVALYPMFNDMLFNSEEKETIATTTIKTEEANEIYITISGEINAPSQSDNKEEVCNSITISFFKGVSYGEIINSIRNLLTGYSIISNDLSQKYYSDSNIVIESSYSYNEKIDLDYIDSVISINNSSYSELIKLYGIGEKRANKIIEYRKNKKIESFEELKKLLGVSDNVIAAIKEEAVL